MSKMIPELLAPAGDLEKAKYAFAFGADAVYAGVPQFALRTKENKFDTKDISAIIEYAHSRGKKVYVTTNIYPHNNKIEPFLEAMEELVKLRPDAFIVSDPGIILLIGDLCSEHSIPLHLSTQANTVNWASAAFWEKQGVKRVILGRELNINEIKTIKEKNPQLECEVFVHGAMCMAYSGRCLISNFLTGRDANQGACAQSCRWNYRVLRTDNSGPATGVQETEYEPVQGNFVVEEKLRPGEFLPIEEDQFGTYLFNSRDICALDYLKDLIDAGVDSLKIEGRNKSVYYVSVVVKAYRVALDAIKEGKDVDTEKLVAEVQSTNNRGFIPGFLAGNPRSAGQRYESNEMMSTHVFAGVLREKEGKRLTFEARNKIDVGDELEIVTPTQVIFHKITTMQDEEGNDIETVHPGQGTFTIEVEEAVQGDFAVARMKGGQKRRN